MSNISTPASPDRRRILRGGLIGSAIGALLIGLAAFFLVAASAPEEILGVFLPLAAGLVALALGVLALVPLFFGDTTERSPAIIAWAFRGFAVVGLVMTVAGIVESTLPWTAFALLPLLVVVSLVRGSLRRPPAG